MIDQFKTSELDVLVEELAARLTSKLKNLSGVSQEYFSIKESAKYTGLSTDLIRDQIHSGRLPASDVGTPNRPTYRIAKENLNKFMKEREAGAIAAPSLRSVPKTSLPPSSHFRKKK